MAFQPLGIGTGSVVAGRYEIARQIGAGAMSAVYIVRDRELAKQEYALKILQGPAAENAADLERFRHEVVLTRKLTHQNIVRTFEFGAISNTQYFMVMELVDGKTLENLIYDSASLSFNQIVNYLTQTAEALSYAHQAGVIHRDLKPANILVSRDGVVKVADFGLAFHSELQMNLTQPGQTVGTPAYMSPERLAGEGSDPRSDVYAFGIMAYEMIAGAYPFKAVDWVQLVQRVTSSSVPLLKKSAKVPAWYDDLVQRCTAKKPGDRFQSATALHAFLLDQKQSADNVVLRRSKPSRRAGRGSAPGWVLAVAGRPSVLVVMIVGMLMIAVGAYMKPVKQVEIAAENVAGGTKVISEFVDSLEKLNKVVQATHQNKDQIEAVLDRLAKEQAREEVQAAAAAAAAPSGTPTASPAPTPTAAPARNK